MDLHDWNDAVSEADGNITVPTLDLEVVVKDYEGAFHNVILDGLNYNEGRMILELHSEIEEDEDG